MGHFEVFKQIFENVEDKNPQNYDKKTPLHYAAIKGHLKICKFIIGNVENKNLAINSKNISNNTPIQMAQNYHHYHVVDYLKSQIKN